MAEEVEITEIPLEMSAEVDEVVELTIGDVLMQDGNSVQMITQEMPLDMQQMQFDGVQMISQEMPLDMQYQILSIESITFSNGQAYQVINGENVLIMEGQMFQFKGNQVFQMLGGFIEIWSGDMKNMEIFDGSSVQIIGGQAYQVINNQQIDDGKPFRLDSNQVFQIRGGLIEMAILGSQGQMTQMQSQITIIESIVFSNGQVFQALNGENVQVMEGHMFQIGGNQVFQMMGGFMEIWSGDAETEIIDGASVQIVSGQAYQLINGQKMAIDNGKPFRIDSNQVFQIRGGLIEMAILESQSQVISNIFIQFINGQPYQLRDGQTIQISEGQFFQMGGGQIFTMNEGFIESISQDSITQDMIEQAVIGDNIQIVGGQFFKQINGESIQLANGEFFRLDGLAFQMQGGSIEMVSQEMIQSASLIGSGGEIIHEMSVQELSIETGPGEVLELEMSVQEIPLEMTSEELLIEETPLEMTSEELLIEETPLEMTSEELLIEETPLEMTSEELLIEETPLEMTSEELLIEETPLEMTSEELLIEETPLEMTSEELSIEETPLEMTSEELLIEETPLEMTSEELLIEEQSLEMMPEELSIEITEQPLPDEMVVETLEITEEPLPEEETVEETLEITEELLPEEEMVEETLEITEEPLPEEETVEEILEITEEPLPEEETVEETLEITEEPLPEEETVEETLEITEEPLPEEETVEEALEITEEPLPEEETVEETLEITEEPLPEEETVEEILEITEEPLAEEETAEETLEITEPKKKPKTKQSKLVESNFSQISESSFRCSHSCSVTPRYDETCQHKFLLEEFREKIIRIEKEKEYLEGKYDELRRDKPFIESYRGLEYSSQGINQGHETLYTPRSECHYCEHACNRRDVSRKTSDSEYYKMKCDLIRKEKENLELAYEGERRQKEDFERECENERSEKQYMERRYETMLHTITRFEDTIRDLRRDNENLQSNLSEWRNAHKLDSLTMVNKDTIGQALSEESETDMIEYKRSLDVLERENKEFREILDAMSKKNESQDNLKGIELGLVREKEYLDLKRERSKFEDIVREQKRTITHQQERIEEIRREQDDQIWTVKEANRKNERKIKELQKSLDERDREIDDLKRVHVEEVHMFEIKLQTESSRRSQYQSKINEMEIKIQRLENDKVRLNEQVSATVKGHTFNDEHFVEDISVYRQKYEEEQRSKVKLANDIKYLLTDIIELKDRNKRMEEDVNRERMEIKNMLEKQANEITQVYLTQITKLQGALSDEIRRREMIENGINPNMTSNSMQVGMPSQPTNQPQMMGSGTPVMMRNDGHTNMMNRPNNLETSLRDEVRKREALEVENKNLLYEMNKLLGGLCGDDVNVEGAQTVERECSQSITAGSSGQHVLQKKNKELMKELQVLKDEIEDMETLARKNKNYKNKIEDLHEELDHVTRKRDDLASLHRNMKRDVEQLSTTLEDVQRKNRQYTDECDRLMKRIQELEDSFKFEKSKLLRKHEMEMENVLEGINRKNGDLQRQIQEQTSIIELLKEKASDAGFDVEDIIEDNINWSQSENNDNYSGPSTDNRKGTSKSNKSSSVKGDSNVSNLKKQVEKLENKLKMSNKRHEDEIRGVEKQKQEMRNEFEKEKQALKQYFSQEKIMLERHLQQAGGSASFPQQGLMATQSLTSNGYQNTGIPNQISSQEAIITAQESNSLFESIPSESSSPGVMTSLTNQPSQTGFQGGLGGVGTSTTHMTPQNTSSPFLPNMANGYGISPQPVKAIHQNKTPQNPISAMNNSTYATGVQGVPLGSEYVSGQCYNPQNGFSNATTAMTTNYRGNPDHADQTMPTQQFAGGPQHVYNTPLGGFAFQEPGASGRMPGGNGVDFERQIQDVQETFAQDKQDILEKAANEKRKLQQNMEQQMGQQEHDMNQKYSAMSLQTPDHPSSRFQSPRASGIATKSSQQLQKSQSDIQKLQKQLQKQRREYEEQNKKLLQEKHDLNNVLQSMTKEISVLKCERRNIRCSTKSEIEKVERMHEMEKTDIKEKYERNKREEISRLRAEYEDRISKERKRLQQSSEELRQKVSSLEQKLREVEVALQNEKHKFERNRKESQRIISQSQEEYKSALEIEYKKRLSNEKQKFEKTLRELRLQISSLQEQRKQIQLKLASKVGGVSSDRISRERMIMQIEQDFLEKLEKEKKPLQEKITDLKDEVSKIKREKNAMKTSMEKEKEDLQEEVERVKDNMKDKLQRAKNEMDRRSDIMNRSILTNNSIAMFADIDCQNQAQSSIKQYQEQLNLLEQRNLTLQSKNERLEREVRVLNGRVTSLEARNRELQGSVTNAGSPSYEMSPRSRSLRIDLSSIRNSNTSHHDSSSYVRQSQMQDGGSYSNILDRVRQTMYTAGSVGTQDRFAAMGSLNGRNVAGMQTSGLNNGMFGGGVGLGYTQRVGTTNYGTVSPQMMSAANGMSATRMMSDGNGMSSVRMMSDVNGMSGSRTISDLNGLQSTQMMSGLNQASGTSMGQSVFGTGTADESQLMSQQNTVSGNSQTGESAMTGVIADDSQLNSSISQSQTNGDIGNTVINDSNNNNEISNEA